MSNSVAAARMTDKNSRIIPLSQKAQERFIFGIVNDAGGIDLAAELGFDGRLKIAKAAAEQRVIARAIDELDVDGHG
jgi:hypothetical protein